MGDRERCRVCNRYANRKLGDLCRACDQTIFIKKSIKMANGSQRVLESVLAEFNAKTYADIKFEQRPKFFNLLQRRSPDLRKGHITNDASKIERYGYRFATDPKEYAIIKEVADIERVE